MKFTAIYSQELGKPAALVARVYFRHAKQALLDAAEALKAQGETISHQTALEVVTAKGKRLYVAA